MTDALPADDIVSTTGASVAKGAVWNASARAIPQLYLVALSIAAARFLGPNDFGRQSFIAFAEYAVITVATAGLPTTLIRFVGDALGRRDLAAARGLVRWAWLIEFAAAVLAAGILATVALAGAEPRLAWLFAAAGAALGVLMAIPIAFLNGLQRWREMSITGLAVNGFAVFATIVALALGWGISGMFGVEVAASGVILLVLIVVARRRERELGRDVRLTPALKRRASRYAGVASINVFLSFIVWRRSEFFVLERYSTNTQIGFYSIAFAAANAPVVVFQALTSVVMPAVSNLMGAGESDRVRDGLGRAVRLLLLLALPATSAGLALVPPLVGLIYGSSFAGARSVVLVALAFIAMVPIISLSAALLVGIGRLWVLVAAGIAASLVDVGLSFLLIPEHGAVAAAIANGAAQLAVGLPVVAYAWRTAGGVDWNPGAVFRVGCCSGLGGLAAWGMVEWLGGVDGLVGGVAAGGLVFFCTASVLPIISHEDALWLEETAGSLVGGVLGRVIKLWTAPYGR